MTGKTSIEWTHQPGYEGDVWNPTTGCTRVSAGCDNCYAFALHDKRHVSNLHAAQIAAAEWRGVRSDGEPMRGPQLIRWARDHGYKMPYAARQYDRPFSQVQLLEDRLADPLRQKKPRCYFVDSMADLFHEDVPDEFLERVFNVMHDAFWHKFLVLTKRPERMSAWVRAYREAWEMPGDPIHGTGNVWLGTSVEDQRAADERIPHLLATPAAVRFLSCEPLLGPIDLSAWTRCPSCDGVGLTDRDAIDGRQFMCLACNRRGHLRTFDWAIIGGESGARARPMDLAWARSLVQQCRAAGVAVFVKQLGTRPVDEARNDCDACRLGLVVAKKVHGWDCELGKVRDRKGGDMSEWPEDLRIREFLR